jgi:hypothetical protein
VLLTVTALATAIQLAQLHMLGIYGRQSTVHEIVAFVGALGLILAAVAQARSRSLSLALGMLSAALLWIFYAPTTEATIREFWKNGRPLTETVVVLLPTVLLSLTSIFCLVHAFLFFKNSRL